MDKSKLEWKVGLFVCIGLALLALLMIQFTKGAAWFRPHYEIKLRAASVSGLRPHAQVLMSGVQIGVVEEIQLGSDGKSVILTLRIYRPFQIRSDSRFVIETAGFLGDQYVAIVPTGQQAPFILPGQQAQAEPPFEIQEVARNATTLMQHFDSTATNVNNALRDARGTILSAQSLTNLSETVSALRHASDRSLVVAANVEALVSSNREAVALSISNLLRFSEALNQSADAFRDLLATNASDVHAAVQNIQASSASVRDLLAGVQQGKGVAGKLLENDQLAANVSQIVSNLSITSSNLNRRGLWGILWEHKPRTPPNPSRQKPLTSPKNPFE
jgi:phospholipid/cholesterol/gamma-HCH transport system substrate-binding protein